MRLEALADDRVLYRHIVHIAANRKGLVATPRYRHVVKDHVLALGNRDAVYTKGRKLVSKRTNTARGVRSM